MIVNLHFVQNNNNNNNNNLTITFVIIMQMVTLDPNIVCQVVNIGKESRVTVSETIWQCVFVMQSVCVR